jgi:hypothetical protein
MKSRLPTCIAARQKETTVKSTISMCITAMTFFAVLSIPTWVTAQEQAKEDHHVSLLGQNAQASGPDTWIFQDRTLPAGLFFSRVLTSAVFDPVSNRMIIFGGINGEDDYSNDVLALTNANGLGGSTAGEWITLIPNGAAGSPPPRAGHAAVYDATNNRMILFGGCPIGTCFNDVWVLSNANGVGGTPTWQQLSPSGGPPSSRLFFSAFYDPSNNRMILFAGLSVDGNQSVPDVWVLSNANGLGGTPSWAQLSPIGGPPLGQIGYAAGYDSANNILIVFGGLESGETTVTNAMWTLSNANGLGGAPTWTNLIANGAAASPSKRAFSTAIYEPSSNRLTLFGGSPGTSLNAFFGQFNDTWVLTNANGKSGTPEWQRLSPATAPPPHTLPAARSGHVAVFDQQHDVMTIFGGGTAEAILRTVWVLTHADGL